MTNHLRQPVNWIGYIGLILTLLGIVISASAQVTEIRATVTTTSERIYNIERDRREVLADYGAWRTSVNEDRATVKAQYAEIMRILQRLERR